MATRARKKPNDTTAASASLAVVTAASGSAGIEGLKALVALDTGSGVFVLLTAPPQSDALTAVDFESAAPGSECAHVRSDQGQGGTIVHAAYVASSVPHAGQIRLRYRSAAGRIGYLQASSFSHASLKSDMLAVLMQRFGSVLLPMLDTHLPVRHPLWSRIDRPARIVPEAVMHHPVIDVPADTVQGCIESVDGAWVHGWVAVSAMPDRHPVVEILSGDRLIGRGLADQAHHGEADHIQVRHHFRIRISYEMLDGAAHRLCLRIPGSGDAVPAGEVEMELAHMQPRHFDWLSREITMQQVGELAQKAKVFNPKARQVLDGLFAKACLAQETMALGDARAGYQKIQTVIGANALCHLKMAETWLLGGDQDQALVEYRTAMRMSPEMVWAQLGVANVLVLQGVHAEAEYLYLDLLEKQPDLMAAKYRHDALQQVLSEIRERLLDEAAGLAFEKTVISSNES